MKSTKFTYHGNFCAYGSRMQKKIPSRSVRGFRGTCLDCTLPGVQVTTDFSFAFRSFNLVKIVTPCSISFSFLAGPWWNSKNRKPVPFLRRMIYLSTTAKKLHHSNDLNEDFRSDLYWWACFLPRWNGVSIMKSVVHGPSYETITPDA